MMTAMHTPAKRNPCYAVRLSEQPDVNEALGRFLDRRAISDAVRFHPRDDDELSTEVSAGRFDVVVFADLDALWTAIWKGEAQVDRWLAAGIRIELADGDFQDWLPHLQRMYASLTQWRRAQRRRQTVAGLILSAVALAAMAVLFFLVPPAR